MNSHLKPIFRDKLDQVADLAREIWQEYYLGMITQEQIDFMLSKFYHRNQLESDLENGVHYFFIQLDDQPMGFIAISEQVKSKFFIHKFYITTDFRGKGMGSKVFSEITQQFPQAQQIRLQVNRKNISSINFYFKNGFSIERWADFDIGNGFEMNDYVMLWNRS
jgi:RimJ/RimL family protein N-acetyltransferase